MAAAISKRTCSTKLCLEKFCSDESSSRRRTVFEATNGFISAVIVFVLAVAVELVTKFKYFFTRKNIGGNKSYHSG